MRKRRVPAADADPRHGGGGVGGYGAANNPASPPAHCIMGVTFALLSAIFLIHFYHEAWQDFGMTQQLLEAAARQNQDNSNDGNKSVKGSVVRMGEHEDISSNTQLRPQKQQPQKSSPTKAMIKESDQKANKGKKRQNKPNHKSDKNNKSYDPLQCEHKQGGKCHDVEGGAWTYKRRNGQCVHNEQTIPGNRDFIASLSSFFSDVRPDKGVLDFGGGLGIYLTGFRNQSSIPQQNLVTMEPHDLGKCLLDGITQDKTNLVQTELKKMPAGRYDMIMTIEVLEHIPVQNHEHLIDAFTKMSNKWLVFSAAHPGQPGQGHVGPSMKTRDEWIAEITKKKKWVYDDVKSKQVLASALELLQQNLAVFRKINYNATKSITSATVLP
jgi:2-polyprenyl-3-methyl-5-hydroxy-6-metoxy-1,4-benzoquinol methylase